MHAKRKKNLTYYIGICWLVNIKCSAKAKNKYHGYTATKYLIDLELKARPDE